MVKSYQKRKQSKNKNMTPSVISDISTQTTFERICQEYQAEILSISVEGPKEIKDYLFLQSFFETISEAKKNGQISKDQIIDTRKWFKGTMSTTETLQGHVCSKPYGYDGDYRIIDKIYRKRVSHIKQYSNWDKFFHEGLASKAVRNRKSYFINLLNQLKPDSKVLNLASGPCTDLLEFSLQSDKHLEIHNIDLDKNAIAYAKNQLKGTDTISTTFEHINIFKFIPNENYDLIWSAGLFDYFDDAVFQKLLTRFIDYVKPSGQMVIGNFSDKNTSRPYMEYGDWYLHHRNEDKLISLSPKKEGFKISVESEPLEVNLFLKIENVLIHDNTTQHNTTQHNTTQHNTKKASKKSKS